MTEALPVTRKRSGSKTRQRQRRISIAVTEAEYAAVEEKASAAGFKIGSYGRATLLGSPAPRARRTPPINAQMLGYAVAQLNRAGNNLNQINRRQNAALSIGANETAAAVSETRACVAAILEIVGRTDKNDRQGKHAQ